MMHGTTELAPSLQRLIDLRLDAVDRHLLDARMPRSERREILSAVEDQVYELLSRCQADEPSREDVLKVLAAMDPPEAYATNERNARTPSAPESEFPRRKSSLPAAMNAPAAPASEPAPAGPQRSALAIVACVAAALAVVSSFTITLLDWYALFFVFIFGITSFVCGLCALIPICRFDTQLRGLALAILGLVGVPVSATVLFVVIMLNR
ncbi:MAG: hypothetical protein ACRCZF_06410 [Gemmataceae bacterium]